MRSSDSTTRDSIASASDLSERSSSFADSLSSTDSSKPQISYDEAKLSAAGAKELVEANPQIATFKGDKGETPLHDAVARGDIHIVQAILDKYPKLIDTPDANGKTPLHYAAENLQGATFKLLQDRGANVAARDRTNTAPYPLRDQTIQTQGYGMILSAAQVGDADRVKDLLAQDPSLAEAKDNTKSLLDHAVENGHPKVVEAISSFYGQQADQANQEKSLATTNLKAKQKELTVLSQQAAALDVEGKKKIFENAEGLLTRKQMDEAIKQVLSDADKTDVSSKAQKRIAEIDGQDNEDKRIAQSLLSDAIKIKTAYKAAQEATKLAKENSDAKQAEFTAAKKQFDTLTSQIEEAGNALKTATLQQEAVAQKQDPIIKAAGEATEKATNRIEEAKAKQQEIQLFSAVKSGKIEEAQALIDKNLALVNIKDKDGKTPLHYAAANLDSKMDDLLRATKGADQTIKDNAGRTADQIGNGMMLISAAKEGRLDYVQSYLKEDPTLVNAQDKDGKTALHHAAEQGNQELFDALKAAGAITQVKAGEKTPEDILADTLKAKEVEKQKELEAAAKLKAITDKAPSLASTSAPSLTNDSSKQVSGNYKLGSYKDLEFTESKGGKDTFEKGQRPMSDPSKPHVVEHEGPNGTYHYTIGNSPNPNDTKLHKVEGKFGTIVFNSAGKMVDADLSPDAHKYLSAENIQQAKAAQRATVSTVDLAQTQQQTQQTQTTTPALDPKLALAASQAPTVTPPVQGQQHHSSLRESLSTHQPVVAPTNTTQGQTNQQTPAHQTEVKSR